MTTELTTLDQYAKIRTLVTDSVSSPASRKSYGHSIGDFCTFLRQTGRALDKSAVNAYKAQLEQRELSPSTINVRLAAVRKLAGEAADNGMLDPVLAAGVARIGGVKKSGVRAGNWLTLDAAQDLLRKPDSSLRGKRDRGILALLIGCGLRRAELVSLTVGHLQQREGRWVLLDLQGKGNRVRTIPVPSWAYSTVSDWLCASGVTHGHLFRSLAKGQMGQAMSTQAIADLVHEYSTAIGHPVAPHDLRRTFARLSHAAGAKLDQLSLSLGHASVTTTEKYINAMQDLVNAPGDLIRMEGSGE
jgi:site-specific recombinase XerD